MKTDYDKGEFFSLCTCICTLECTIHNYHTLQVLPIVVSCIYACAAITSVVFVYSKTLTKSLAYMGISEEIQSSEKKTTGFECITTGTSISNKKYLRQTKNVLVLCTVLRNITTHQTQYVTDLRNCLLFLHCNCCYKGWMSMYKHLIQVVNKDN